MTDHRDEHEPYGFTESPVIARLQDEIACLRAELKVMNEEHRLACDDRDLMMRERDRARRAYCAAAYRLDSKGESTPMSIAHQQGWDCFKEDGK